jgi:hypothetical protein
VLILLLHGPQRSEEKAPDKKKKLLHGPQRSEEKERADPLNAPDQKKKAVTREIFFFPFLFPRQERADAPNAPDKKKEKATAPGFGEGATGSTKPTRT